MVPKNHPQHDAIVAQFKSEAAQTRQRQCEQLAQPPAKLPAGSTVSPQAGESFRDGRAFNCSFGDAAYATESTVYGYGYNVWWSIDQQGHNWSTQTATQNCFEQVGCTYLTSTGYDPNVKPTNLSLCWTGPASILDYWCSSPTPG
jgi:hypothetical protein